MNCGRHSTSMCTTYHTGVRRPGTADESKLVSHDCIRCTLSARIRAVSAGAKSGSCGGAAGRSCTPRAETAQSWARDHVAGAITRQPPAQHGSSRVSESSRRRRAARCGWPGNGGAVQTAVLPSSRQPAHTSALVRLVTSSYPAGPPQLEVRSNATPCTARPAPSSFNCPA
jgi:hypothetical protein